MPFATWNWLITFPAMWGPQDSKAGENNGFLGDISKIIEVVKWVINQQTQLGGSTL